MGTGDPRLEAACRAALEKLKHIARCESAYAAFKALACKGCSETAIPQAEAAKRAACLSIEVSARSDYLKHKCDYVLPGSIARGSQKAERGHRIQVAEKAAAFSICLAKAGKSV